MQDAVSEILYPCKFDASRRPAMCYFSEAPGPRPLVVGLHTWSGDYTQPTYQKFASLCAARNWHMIFPDFRGPNWQKAGCGSDLVVSDLEDAVAYMCSRVSVDPGRIYLTGGSGGGHCSLLMAGRRPDLWTAVSSWCPITDIAAWYRQCRGTRCEGYSDHIACACGGNPLTSEDSAREAALRSPLTWLPNAWDVPLDINTGIHDGHAGSVPVSQAVNAYNLLAAPEDRISSRDMAYMVENEKVPASLLASEPDPAYGSYRVLLRKQSRKVRLTVFEGAHDMLYDAAFEWLDRQISRNQPDFSCGAACGDTGDAGLAR